MRCVRCGSYAINHNAHGRDGSDGELCDVCYWRKFADELTEQHAAEIATLEQEARQMRARNERLEGEIASARRDIAALDSMLAEARANDMTSFCHLSAIREAIRFDGSFPALVERCKSLREELAEAERKQGFCFACAAELSTNKAHSEHAATSKNERGDK